MSDQKADADEFFERTNRTLSLFMAAFCLLGFLLGFSVGIGIKHPDLTATVELKIEGKK